MLSEVGYPSASAPAVAFVLALYKPGTTFRGLASWADSLQCKGAQRERQREHGDSAAVPSREKTPSSVVDGRKKREISDLALPPGPPSFL